MTIPKKHEPVRMPCEHYPDFCARNAVEGSNRCELHQQKTVIVTKSPRDGGYPSLDESLGLLPDFELDSLAETVPYKRTRRVYQPTARIQESEPRQVLLPFEYRGGNMLTGAPFRPFKPKGLMLWNANDLNVVATYVGMQEQILCATGQVPTRWWSTQQSFEEVCKALAEGKEAASWGTWDLATPGVLIRLMFDGDVQNVQAVMWGMSV